MYNSQYYTCEQIDERLLQGYVDDYNTQTGQSLTKEQFLTKLGNVFAKETVIDNTAVNIGYFVCDTAAGTAAKTLTAAGYELFQGGSIKVKFTNRNTAGSATLNINSKGAKALYYGGKAVSASNSWDNGEVVEIYYDGTSYYANNVEGNFKDGIFDISAYNLTEGQPTKYATLAEALGTNGNNVPPIFRKGGMQIKYVSTSDNKYVQYFLTKDVWSASEADWGQLGQDVSPNINKILRWADMPNYNGWIAQDTFTYVTSAPIGKHKVVPVSSKDVVTIQAGSNNCLLFIVSDYKQPTSDDESPIFATGEGSRIVIQSNTELRLVLPQDTAYIVIGSEFNGNNYQPSSIYVNDFEIISSTSEIAFDKVKALQEGDGVLTNNVNLKKINANVIRERQNGVEPYFKINKKVGDEIYIHMKVEFPDDIHLTNTDQTFFTIGKKGGTTFKAILHKATPITKDAGNYSDYPVPTYRAYLCSKLNEGADPNYGYFARPDGADINLFLGKDAMSLRFTGDCSLPENQDLRLAITSTEIKIYHYSSGVIVRSYSKATYSSVASLFNAIKSDIDNNVLQNYEIEFLDVLGHDISDIIPCEVRLVSQYKVYQDGDAPSNPTGLSYEAFPFYFTFREIGKVYDVEFLISKKTSIPSQLVIDGFGMKFASEDMNVINSTILNQDCELAFGVQSTGVSSSVPKILSFEIKDRIEAQRPILKIYYAENIQAGISGNDSYYTSQGKLVQLFNMLQKNNFETISLQDIISYLNGVSLKNTNGKVFHFSNDDCAPTTLDDDKTKQLFLSHNVSPSYGVLTGEDWSPEKIAIVNCVRNVGYYFFIHTIADTDLANKSIGYLGYDDMLSAFRNTISAFKNKFGIYPIVWDFHEEGENYNNIRWLINHGFQLIFGKTGRGSINTVNRYHCARETWRNNSQESAITPYLDNYYSFM